MRSTTKFYIFHALSALGFGFVATLYVPYLHEIGLGPAEVTLLNGLFWLFSIGFELPTGMIADGRGRGFSVASGALSVAVGAILYAFADGFWTALPSEIFIGLGHAFFSGALNAWITDAPDRDPERENLEHIFGTSTAFRGMAMVAGVLVGTWLAELYGAGLCYVLYGAGHLLAFAFAYVYMQEGNGERPLKEFAALANAWAHLKKSAELRFALALDLLSASFMLINLFWAPLFLGRFKEVGWGEVELGWLFCAMYGVIVVSGYVVKKVGQKRISIRTGLATTLLWVSLVVISFSFTDNLGAWIVLILAYEIGWGVFGPFMNAYMHARVPGEFRATFESMQSFAWSLAVAIILAVATALLWGQEVSAEQTLAVWRYTGLVLAVLTGLAWCLRPRLKG